METLNKLKDEFINEFNKYRTLNGDSIELADVVEKMFIELDLSGLVQYQYVDRFELMESFDLNDNQVNIIMNTLDDITWLQNDDLKEIIDEVKE